MLDYLSKIIDDAQDFGWSAAKGSQAVLLCCMEDNKVSWKQTEKLTVFAEPMRKKLALKIKVWLTKN